MALAISQRGLAGLHDRSSRPHRLRRPTPQAVVTEVGRLRRQRYTGKQIAAELRISPATVSRILRRLGLNRLAALEPAEPVRRYEREHPGELIHLDIKKLGRFDHVGHRITGDRRGQSNSRGIGWEFVHVCIDDASRIAYAEIMKNERKESAIAFLKAAIAYYASLGVKRAARHDRQRLLLQISAFGRACKRLGLKHIRTRPYTPKTNGKAERFIQTAFANGHMLAPTTLRLNAAQNCRSGFTATIGTDLMAVSGQTSHQPTRPDREQPIEAPHLEQSTHVMSSLLRQFDPYLISYFSPKSHLVLKPLFGVVRRGGWHRTH